MILFLYLVRELIFPIFLALGVISSILMMDQVYKFIPFLQTTGMDVKPLLRMALYSLPTILMIATPISLMIGTYIGIQRASSDYEVIAMRASGVSLGFIFRPVLFVSFVIALVVMAQAFYLSPLGVTKLEELKFNILKRQTKLNLSAGKINNFFGQRMIYFAEKDQNDLLRGVFIGEWDVPESRSVIEADRGRIDFDEKNQKILFRLSHGKIHQELEALNYRVINFEHLDYHLSPPRARQGNIPAKYLEESDSTSKMDTEMTINELYTNIGKVKPKSKPYFAYIDEMHGRIVTVLSCLSFAIFALPMAIYDPRNPKTGKFVYMILMMIVYYTIFSQARSLLVHGKASPAGVYLPLVFAVFIGLVNFLKVNYDLSS